MWRKAVSAGRQFRFGERTLIRCVAERWVRNSPALYTPRRYITRPPHPSEPYISLERDAFARMRTCQGFFLDWVSYGIHYGLPNDIAGYLEQGAFSWPMSAGMSSTGRGNGMPAPGWFSSRCLMRRRLPACGTAVESSPVHWLPCPFAACPTESVASVGRLYFGQ